MMQRTSSELVPITTLQGKLLPELRDWWHRLASTGAKPTKADFNLRDWKSHLPWITAVDTLRDAGGRLVDVHYKVYGSRLVDVFGGDFTGQSLSDFGEPFISRWLGGVQVAEASQEPAAASGRVLIPDRDFIRFEVLFVPLFDKNGVIERYICEFELLKEAGPG